MRISPKILTSGLTKTLLGISVFSLSAFASTVRAEEHTLSKGQKYFEPITAENVDLIVQNVISGAQTKLKDRIQVFPSEEAISDFWLGNRPYLSTSIDTIQVKFNVSPLGGGEIVPVTLGLTLKDSEIIVRHSLPYFRKQLGGIRVTGTDHYKLNQVFFRAKNGSGLVILIPNYSKRERNRAIVMCPREFDYKGSREERSRLAPVEWNVDEVSLRVSADVRGSVRSSIDMVKARAEILSSPAVAPSVAWKDQIYSKNAGVSLFYKPRGDFIPYQVDGNTRVEGIESYLDLHAHTGYRRVSRMMSLLHIIPVSLPEFKMSIPLAQLGGTAIEAELKQRGIDLQVQSVIGVDVLAGGCYLVLNEAGSIIHEYLKEPFQPPQN